ncbi:hypothetical protein [Halomonas llamarensis]|uniref:Uncharacterized protein n=1 Tax=Halomonas llamarensis TaxID=2945104 RepID=A0ABT0SLW6_9GAMM|nr:hypothetical protein [Halomonas llamarensis]MCL7928769.1 hypothetical protein [Halomonas llamarensis]
MSEQTIAIVGVAIGALGFLFGVYAHFANRRVAKLIYKVSQISDFKVPQSFVDDMQSAPVSITLTSVGSKAAKSIVGKFGFQSEIAAIETTPEGINPKIEDKSFSFEAASLNPSQEVHFSVKVKGNPAEDQVESVNVSHEEGVASPPSAIGKISYRFLGVEFELDLLTNQFKINQFGPWSR